MTQSKPQNPPRRHHYIPEFYQKKWAIEGNLTVFIRTYGRVRTHIKSPSATGYVELLYTMNELPKNEAQLIEVEYMSPVDGLAAIARDGLLDRRHLTPKERFAWIQFIMSLWLRTPEEIKLFKASYMEQAEKLKPARAEQYLRDRDETDPETFDKYLQSIGPGGVQRAMMHLFLQMISNNNIAKIINSMQWSCIDVSSGPYELMTSDRPIVMPYGLGKDKAYIAMPLSPNTLFVAANKNGFVMSQLKQRGISGVVADVNAAVVGQAYKYVYSTNERQRKFVENRMSSLPRYSIIERLISKFEDAGM